MKALVTGATGFIGSHLTRGLVEAGWTVHVLKRPTSSMQRLQTLADSLQTHDIDGTDFQTTWNSVGPVDVVFHLATAYGRDSQTDIEVEQTNVVFPQRLLMQAGAERVPLCIATDTCFPASYPYLQAYTRSKKRLASWGQEWARETGNRFVNLVLQHPFGPDDGKGKFVPWVIEQCLGNVDSIDLTAGDQQKDFVYVGDVVNALIHISQQQASLPPGFSKFECGSGVARSVRSFVELIHATAQSTSQLNFGALPVRAGEPAVSCADITALDSIGWTSKTGVAEGVRLAVEWQREKWQRENRTTC